MTGQRSTPAKKTPTGNRAQRRAKKTEQAAPPEIDFNELPGVFVIPVDGPPGTPPAVRLRGNVDPHAAPTLLRRAAKQVERELGLE